MTSRDFVFWLMGYFEVSDPDSIGPSETEMIKKHLALVFKHEIDPAMGDDEHQEELNSIHSGEQDYIHPGFNSDDKDPGILRC